MHAALSGEVAVAASGQPFGLVPRKRLVAPVHVPPPQVHVQADVGLGPCASRSEDCDRAGHVGRASGEKEMGRQPAGGAGTHWKLAAHAGSSQSVVPLQSLSIPSSQTSWSLVFVQAGAASGPASLSGLGPRLRLAKPRDALEVPEADEHAAAPDGEERDGAAERLGQDGSHDSKHV